MSSLRVLALIFVFVIFYTFPVSALAATPPSFPACANPQGTVKASYPSGTFGIVGQTGSVSGSDTVYTLSDISLTQCFCASDGSGIQTDWWKVNLLTSEEINEMTAQGWIFVPDGSVWGLTADPYLAKNTNYSCGGGVALSSTTSNSTSSTNNSSNSNIGGGSVLGSSTPGSVLGLAATGNLQVAYLLLALGILTISSGIVVKHK